MRNFKKIIFTVSTLFFALQSCESQKTVVNREVETTNDGKMLLGNQTKDQLLKAPYREWYKKEHDEYTLDQKSIAELKKEKLNSYKITLVMGTWCEDSHREVPRFFKILEAIEYPENKLTMIAVNRQKEAPSGEEGPLNIQRVPTIIVQKYGKEIGRIIESPSTGYLERDLLEILKKDNTSLKDLIK
jgi:thiol-disulfide isomerase/thioredoxin